MGVPYGRSTCAERVSLVSLELVATEVCSLEVDMFEVDRQG